MNKMSSITQRDSFWNRVYEIARQDRNVILVSADMGAPSLDKFRRNLPSQFVNAGIAEQNAILLAVGLAMTGKKVFAYAIAPFITLRCLEQIRIEVAMMNIPITIVGVGAGLGYEDSGPTHHLTEDIAVMRAMPNIQIHSITDSIMASAYADISCGLKVPNYIRLERQFAPEIYTKGADFSRGFTVLKKGKDCQIISTGVMTHTALEIAESLKAKKISAGVIDLYSLPINAKDLLPVVKDCRKLITVEEHFLPGGMGSAVAEFMVDNSVLIPLKRIGFPIEKGYCYKYGGRENLRKYYGADKGGIEQTIIRFVKKG